MEVWTVETKTGAGRGSPHPVLLGYRLFRGKEDAQESAEKEAERRGGQRSVAVDPDGRFEDREAADGTRIIVRPVPVAGEGD